MVTTAIVCGDGCVGVCVQVAENMETRSVNHSRDMKTLSTNLQ